MTTSKFSYAPLDLGPFTSFEEKLDVAINWLEISEVFCRLKKRTDPDNSSTEEQTVIEIAVPGGKPGYILSLLKDVREIISNAVDDYVDNSETDLYTITQSLKEAKEKCIFQSKVNDITNSLEYDPGKIKFMSFKNNHPDILYFDHLKFSKTAKDRLSDHFYIRKAFYEAMAEIISKKIVDIQEPLTYTKQPYKWDSENPHYEIAELLHALISTRIKIKEGEKGSTAKLVKGFFNLFGYDDGSYHRKLQQINKRQAKSSWLKELPDFIDSIQKKAVHSKK